MLRAKMLGMAAMIAAGLATASTAQAAPFGFGPGAPDGSVLIERVAGGCGPGFHPNPWGHCRPNGWGWGGPRGPYGGRPDYGYGRGYDRGHGGYGGYDGPRRYYGGY
jgi:hypothetical protein